VYRILSFNTPACRRKREGRYRNAILGISGIAVKRKWEKADGV